MSNTASPSLLQINGTVAESCVDGPGLRYALFVQGCPHHCPGCHNPQSQEFGAGAAVAVSDILNEILANPLLSGVTFSGGEPLCQPAALVELAATVRARGLHIALYTGYTFEELLRENDAARMNLLALCDVLVDGRFSEAHRSLSLRFAGSTNQRVLDLPASLQSGRAVADTSGEW